MRGALAGQSGDGVYASWVTNRLYREPTMCWALGSLGPQGGDQPAPASLERTFWGPILTVNIWRRSPARRVPGRALCGWEQGSKPQTCLWGLRIAPLPQIGVS